MSLTSAVNNLRFATKLAISSGLSALLVGGLVVTQLLSNATIRTASENTVREREIVEFSLEVRANLRGMQVGARDWRLARNAEEAQKAQDSMSLRHTAGDKSFDRIVERLRDGETRERFKKIQDFFGGYYTRSLEFAKIKAEIFALEAKPRNNADEIAAVDARRAALIEQLTAYARESTLPMAAEAEKALDAGIEAAARKAAEATATTAREMTSSERTAVGLSIAVALVLIGSAVFLLLVVGRPIRAMTGGLIELAGGNYGIVLPGLARKDEIGEIARAVDTLKVKAADQARLEAEKATAEVESRKVFADNMRIRVALDNCTTNVMVADTDGQILYMNKSVMEMMKAAEPELRKELKGFDAGRLVGASIDTFHKNPAHQRAMLERLSSTHRTSISIAGLSFQLIANPVLDSNGTRLGSVVEWHDLTQERKVEDEIDQVVSAAVGGNFRETIRLEG
ncbi:MAG: HAMP domain-containing protein, partial [Xanthobacteraceae bacterium]